MPQTMGPSGPSESEDRRGTVKPSHLSVEKSEQAPQFKAKTDLEQKSNSIRQSKCLSSTTHSSVLCMRRLQSQTGLSLHPYQSSHPGGARLDLHIASRDNLSSFTQRVMSAKLLRLKQLQNQLSEAHLQLNELVTENKLLRSLQKRQDLALDRYEGTQAQLPQLVRSHQEEVRVMRTKYKNLKQQYRSLTNTLKEREAELQNLKEQHGHLLKLSKDRNLSERESLSKQVNDLKMTVENQSSTIQILNRKVLLETKNLKFQLHQEVLKHKTTQSELQQSYMKIDELQTQLDQVKGRNALPASMDRLGRISSSLKLATGHKPSKGVIVDRALPQNYKIKRTSKGIAMPVSCNDTGSSSMQLDSSAATLNEFSASIDSTPEHTTNKIDACGAFLPSSIKSDSYQLHRSILQQDGIDLNVNFDSERGRTNSDVCPSLGSVTNDVLEKEYENAVAMLAKLSNKQIDSFEDDISSSLASLDLTSAKHVAALANATFALKGETLSKTKFKQDKPPSHQDTSLEKDDDEAPSIFTECVEGSIDDKMSRRASALFQVSEVPHDAVSRNLTDNVGIKLESPKCTDDKSMIKHEPGGVRQDGVSPKCNKSREEEVGASCKEALLKALKAIDDSSYQGNDSDDSDSTVTKMSSTVISQRMFSTLSASRNGIGDKLGSSKRAKPFK